MNKLVDKLAADKNILIYSQMILVIVVACCWLFNQEKIAFWSALLGGLAWIAPSIYFVIRCMKVQFILQPQKLMRRFFRAEFVKFLLSGALIILFVSIFAVQPIPFLTGFSAAVIAPIILTLIQHRQ